MFHNKSIDQLLQEFQVNPTNGLNADQVKKNEDKYGLNKLPESKKQSWFIKLIGQFKEFLVLVLVVAAVISFLVGKITDAIVILVIVVANGIMGFIQERKAENAIEALKKFSVPFCKVWREGQVIQINAEALVPGDIVILEAGDKVPADARLLEVARLEVSESMLTGESHAVQKNIDTLHEENLALGDRLNMIYKDSIVVYGRGRAIVVATGEHTEMGKISQMLQGTVSSPTTLEKELSHVGKVLTLLAMISALGVFISMYFSTALDLEHAFLTAISIAIAVVPEGIPAVITTVLAIAVSRLAKNKATTRKMQAVETLGSINCILTDKTGTLTKNEMTVTELYTSEGHFTLSYEGQFFQDDKPIDPQQKETLKWLLTCAVLCNDAQKGIDGKFIGDPTEACLIEAAMKAGLDVKKLRAENERIFEIPFSSDTKRMVVVVKTPEGKHFAMIKGAAEVVHDALTEKNELVLRISEKLSSEGIRTLAFSFRELSEADLKKQNFEALTLQDHGYIGIIGAKDPLRPEIKQAVLLAKQAGIRTVMITGDHKLIAQSIGMELGLIKNEQGVMDGTQLEGKNVEEIKTLLNRINVFSRVSPEQKLKIVQAAQERGEIVAVTGDGVNDAPAIKRADIGIAMGISGTDVTKEVADIVLQDDNYSTIVTAIKNGRAIFNNFIKFLRYQISCNLSGVFIVFIITILGYSAPLMPIHILLLNLVSETGPSIALGLEPAEKDVMQKKPRPRTERLLNRRRWAGVIYEAFLMTISGVGAYFLALKFQPEALITATLTTAFLSRLFHSLNCRSEEHSIFSSALKRNRVLNLNIIVTLIFFMMLVYLPFFNSYVHTVPLTPLMLGISVLLAFIPMVGAELYKMMRFRQG